jgi:branched-chain amino acid transport system substrate-binding protein
VGVSGIFNMSPEDHNGLTPEAFVMVKIEQGKLKIPSSI